jgi:hypothetical protein
MGFVPCSHATARRLALCALVVATAAPAPRAQEPTAKPAAPDATKLPDGAVGPRNRWYVRGGCAARTGMVLTEPPLREPEPAWQYDAKGTIDGEPLVWDDLVVLEVIA